jgi:hypothetical protein
MADIPRGKTPPDMWPDGEILEGMTWADETRGLQQLRLAFEVVRQQAKTLTEEVTQEMDRLGLPLPTDKANS